MGHFARMQALSTYLTTAFSCSFEHSDAGGTKEINCGGAALLTSWCDAQFIAAVNAASL